MPVDFADLIPNSARPGTPPSNPPAGAINFDDLVPNASQPAGDGSRGGVTANNVVRATASGVPVVGGLLNRMNAATNATIAPVLDAITPDWLLEPLPGNNWRERFDNSLAMQEGDDQAFHEEHPVLATGLNVAGGIASMAPVAATGIGATALSLRGANLGTRTLASTATGAGIGAADAATRGQDAVTGALVGGGIGAVAPAAGNLVSSIVRGRANAAARRAVPTTEQLAQQAHRAYDAAEAVGLSVQPRSYVRLAQTMGHTLQDAGYNPRLHPAIRAGVEEAIHVGQSGNIDLRSLDQLRRVIRSAGRDTTNPDQARIADALIDNIDDYLGGLVGKDVIAGDPRQAAAHILQARDLWSRMRKGEVIDDIFERARNAAGANYTQAGLETALRQQFRALANNKRVFGRFSRTEKDAILRVVRGGPVENLTRLVGKFAIRGPVSGMASLGVGNAVGGPMAGLGLAAVGEGAKRAAAATTVRNAENVGAMVRNGGTLPQAPASIGRGAGSAATLLLEAGGLPVYRDTFAVPAGR